MNKVVLSWLIMLLSMDANPVEYYKCRDPQGRISYTDRQCYIIGSVDVGNNKKFSSESLAEQDFPHEKKLKPNPESDKNSLPVIKGQLTSDANDLTNSLAPKQSVWQGLMSKITSLFSFSKAKAEIPVAPNPVISNTLPKPIFTCKGKTRCTEMTSCEEAKFYLKNCPNVKLDGDKNGIPCEKQWCN